MTKAVWLAFGTKNVPLELKKRHARKCKCRELLDLQGWEIDGPFAQHCQKMMNARRGAFFDARALKLPWAEGAEAARAKSVDGAKTRRCKISAVNAANETATAVFLDGEERAVFFSDLKAPKSSQRT
jgi:hypothetical protein